VVLELNNRGVQRAAGLRVGTRSTCRLDESLTKPFDFGELLARMRAFRSPSRLPGRRGELASQALRFGNPAAHYGVHEAELENKSAASRRLLPLVEGTRPDVGRGNGSHFSERQNATTSSQTDGSSRIGGNEWLSRRTAPASCAICSGDISQRNVSDTAIAVFSARLPIASSRFRSSVE